MLTVNLLTDKFEYSYRQMSLITVGTLLLLTQSQVSVEPFFYSEDTRLKNGKIGSTYPSSFSCT
jgi:hypothetical protein